MGTLLVNNNFGIVGGRDTEDDESYRYRISLKLKSQSGINEAALRFAILQVPGIQDIVFSPFVGGFYVYVYGISPVVPASLLRAVDDQIGQYAAYLINLASSAVTPDLVGISLSTTLTFTSGVSQSPCPNSIKTCTHDLVLTRPLAKRRIFPAIIFTIWEIWDVAVEIGAWWAARLISPGSDFPNCLYCNGLGTQTSSSSYESWGRSIRNQGWWGDRSEGRVGRNH
jgi:hypothetical protein